MQQDTSPHATLLQAIENRQAGVAVIGLGYVGLPLALRFVEQGFPVIGFDVDAAKVHALNAGESYIRQFSAERVAAARRAGFHATSDYSELAAADAIVICVPTPLGKDRAPDLSFVRSTLDAIQPHLRKGQLVSLESTTYPGTTEEEVLPRIESTGLRPGLDVFVVYSPEREDPGNADFSTATIPKVCAGLTRDCLKAGEALYGSIVNTVVPVSSLRIAEMAKLLENIHRAVNIGLVNEMKIVADRMGIDINEVIDAAATKPFGFVPYRPGPGYGGHCIPIDPFYLAWKARQYGVNPRFIELAGEVNRDMIDFVFDKVRQALAGQGKDLAGSRILVLGIAYKKNVDDTRESPAVKLMERLRSAAAIPLYSDPFVPRFPDMRDHSFDLESVELTAEVIESADCVVIATDHDAVDYEMLARHAAVIVDTRGVYRQRLPNVLPA